MQVSTPSSRWHSGRLTDHLYRRAPRRHSAPVGQGAAASGLTSTEMPMCITSWRPTAYVDVAEVYSLRADVTPMSPTARFRCSLDWHMLCRYAAKRPGMNWPLSCQRSRRTGLVRLTRRGSVGSVLNLPFPHSGVHLTNSVRSERAQSHISMLGGRRRLLRNLLRIAASRTRAPGYRLSTVVYSYCMERNWIWNRT